MGRVAKYKKIKSCDPFSKQNKSKSRRDDEFCFGFDGTDRIRPQKMAKRDRKKHNRANPTKWKRRKEEISYDAPPPQDDDFEIGSLHKVRKDKRKLDSLEGAIERIADVSSSSGGGTGGGNIPRTAQEEKKIARILKLGAGNMKQNPSADNKKAIEGRMEGESMRAFDRRVKDETRMILAKSMQGSGGTGMSALKNANRERYDKKRIFFEKKKQRKKKCSGGYEYQNDTAQDEDDNDDTFMTGERAVAMSHFGDQVERPPEFKVLPRGAKRKEKKLSGGGGLESDENKAAERRQMEKMREKARMQYALMKQKRRKDGDFHL
mmetsp:Transcript_47944/g.71011  ORF Transcript_47944/g.71011 Transcript_47944/m.71011 type:complete len:321 (+) Transcript_47944:106-1068(+)|eukprot:CAMPEP_0195521596 /NCGR_PEP_ID=MMETSP0794_2-20130614/19002_1 /TAXON_ID=515487 /ORGANISM="Stephanopyxis turris, Strain CCMP 815" /LENGTH=320 /DNA_ID=CAMNT_0040651179 /DNA_START=106 /DNA_END=1068 /DNA_ORIENTATION=+